MFVGVYLGSAAGIEPVRTGHVFVKCFRQLLERDQSGLDSSRVRTS
jgi:hypothetical protein